MIGKPMMLNTIEFEKWSSKINAIIDQSSELRDLLKTLGIDVRKLTSAE